MRVPLYHDLSENEAMAKAKLLLSRLAHKHRDLISSLKEDWTGTNCSFSFRAKGKEITGQVSVESSEVLFQASLPLFFRLLEKRIESDLREEWEKLLKE